MTHFSEIDSTLAYVGDSFSTWFSASNNLISEALVIFCRNYAGYSIMHADFDTITALVNPSYLPYIELQKVFSDLYTFVEPCTLEKP